MRDKEVLVDKALAARPLLTVLMMLPLAACVSPSPGSPETRPTSAPITTPSMATPSASTVPATTSVSVTLAFTGKPALTLAKKGKPRAPAHVKIGTKLQFTTSYSLTGTIAEPALDQAPTSSQQSSTANGMTAGTADGTASGTAANANGVTTAPPATTVPADAVKKLCPPTIRYQWLLDGKPLKKATSNKLTVTKGQAGHKISVKATLTCVPAAGPAAGATPAALPDGQPLMIVTTAPAAASLTSGSVSVDKPAPAKTSVPKPASSGKPTSTASPAKSSSSASKPSTAKKTSTKKKPQASKKKASKKPAAKKPSSKPKTPQCPPGFSPYNRTCEENSHIAEMRRQCASMGPNQRKSDSMCKAVGMA